MTSPEPESAISSSRKIRRFLGALVNLGESRAHASAVERETFRQLAALEERLRTIETFVETPGNESRETLSRRAAIDNQLLSVPHSLRALSMRVDAIAGALQRDKA